MRNRRFYIKKNKQTYEMWYEWATYELNSKDICFPFDFFPQFYIIL